MNDMPHPSRLALDVARRKVLLRVGKVELGQHVNDAFRALVARDLGVHIDAVEVAQVSTATSPDDGLTSGSLSMQITGPHVTKDVLALRDSLRAAAARRLNTSAETVDLDPETQTYSAAGMTCDLFDLASEAETPVVHATAPDALTPSLAGSITGARQYIQDMALPGMLHARALRGRIVSDAVSLPEGVGVMTDGGFSALVAEREPDLLAAWNTIVSHQPAAPDGDTGCDGPVRNWIKTRRVDRTDVLEATPTGRGTRHKLAASRPFIVHASIAPSCALAKFEDGVLSVWTHSQGIFNLRNAMARVLGMDPEALVVTHVPSAGCYGHNPADDAAMDAALVALQVKGRPVRISWSREDEFTQAPVGAPMLVEVEAEISEDGRILSWEQMIWSGAHGQRPGRGDNVNLLGATERDSQWRSVKIGDIALQTGGGADRNAVPAYEVGGLTISKHILQDLPVRSSSLRGLGNQVNTIAIEAMMDQLAEHCGMDPVAYRLKTITDPRGVAVMQALSDKLAHDPPKLDENEAIGVAYCRYKNSAAYAAVAVRLRLEDAPKLVEVWTVVDAGCVVDDSGARNQIEGGIVQAASWTLCEGALLRNGVPEIAGWDDYPIIGWAEIPEVHVDLIPHGPDMPALGVGECMVGPISAAIVNALTQIVGQPVTDLPLTRDRLISVMAGD